MLTVPQAARRARKNPETVRRWIRAGRLRSQKVGTQHLIEESDLEALLTDPDDYTPPGGWGTLPSGAPAPNWAKAIREIRDSS
jgi:excisionase family DNA binding protein